MIAIHNRKGSFSDKWIEYCENHKIEYKIVNCYDSEIITMMKDCDILMWHWHHDDYKAIQFARQLIYSLELSGKKVFPNSNTCWHFDDKIGQKYLFESMQVPLINSYVFYDKASTLEWINKTTFPKVFKLKGGAGAQNVSLIKSKSEAIKLASKAFSTGFKKMDRFNALKDKVWQFKRDKNLKSFLNISKGLYRVFFRTEESKNLPLEKNYFYAQEFIPNNDSDIRVITIGDRAFAIKRMVRKGDFRASGSGNIIYNPNEIPNECVKIALETSRIIKTQCSAYDFVILDNKPLIVEVSYAFSQAGYYKCPGYWDKQLNWIEGTFTPEFFMIEDILKN